VQNLLVLEQEALEYFAHASGMELYNSSSSGNNYVMRQIVASIGNCQQVKSFIYAASTEAVWTKQDVNCNPQHRYL
jgi:hypothetical protein